MPRHKEKMPEEPNSPTWFSLKYDIS